MHQIMKHSGGVFSLPPGEGTCFQTSVLSEPAAYVPNKMKHTTIGVQYVLPLEHAGYTR